MEALLEKYPDSWASEQGVLIFTPRGLSQPYETFAENSFRNYNKNSFRNYRIYLHYFFRWPNSTERAAISNIFDEKFGLRGAVGVVDGTDVVLSQRPAIDGEVYWSRKQHYGISAQVVCDHRRMIRDYYVGWPGNNNIYTSSYILIIMSFNLGWRRFQIVKTLQDANTILFTY
jgi:hypothetical protein